MVSVTYDWNGFKAYSENCRVGTYQIKQVENGFQIRVQTGRLGFVENFKNEEDEKLHGIVKFCKLHGFILVDHSVPDEQFHS